MKHFSTILNVVLILAVAFLYYHAFGSKKNGAVPAIKSGTSAVTKNSPQTTIAYVDLDSLNEKIIFIKERRKELETEQKAIETEWQSGYRNLEAQKNNFLKKGNAITQQMAEEFQGELMQQQQKIDERKQNYGQKLTEKSYKFMDDIQKKLKTFLEEYNQKKNYQYILTTGTGLDYMVFKDSTLNITNDVIKGMNEKLNKGN